MKKRYFYLFLLTLACTLNAQTNGELPLQKWAQTPPMGWNSFDCYGSTVVESEVKSNADYMAQHLKPFGWEYIVIDIRWYDAEKESSHHYNLKDANYVIDEYGRLMPDVVRFPSSANGAGFKPLADYIHSKGLKFGVHLMRGIPRKAVKKNTPILGSNAKASEIYNEEVLCTWLTDMYTVDHSKNGAQEYYNSVFNLYASWGLDFIKIDDLSFPYHQEEIEMIRKAIDQCGREIVLSASPGPTPIEDAEHVKSHANMWRVIGDLWDRWEQVKHLFDVCNRWSPHITHGHFPDADMLPLGRVGIRAEMGEDRLCELTLEEQRTLMALFAIFRSPLMFGGDLPGTDPATLSLITNKELLNINQNSTNNRQLFRKGDLVAWTADDPNTGDTFLALFNLQDQIPVIESRAFWKSEVLSAFQNKLSTQVEVDLPKTKKIYLYVSDGGNGNFYDHADWIEPTLSGPNGKLKLTDIEWVKATSGWGKTMVNRSIGNGVLNVAGKEYTNGIGTHANSLIEFDIPEGYNHFSATVGLDKGALAHPERASVQFSVFTEDPAGVKPSEATAIKVNFSELGLEGSYYIKDLWTNTNLGKFSKSFAPEIKLHDAGLYRISKEK
jgi:hypothetical protein